MYPSNESPDNSDTIDIVSVNPQDIADRPYVSAMFRFCDTSKKEKSHGKTNTPAAASPQWH